MPSDIIESCYDHKYVRMPRKWKKMKIMKKKSEKKMKEKEKKKEK